MTRLAILVVALLACATAASADIAVDPTNLPPPQEARAQAVMRSLRCLVCQNESIADSNADLARDLREIVRLRIAAGDSDTAVRGYLVRRYGDWVLLDPPFKPATALLWLSPLLVLLAGGAAIMLHQRGRARGADTPDGVPLDADEKRLLAEALATPADRPEDGKAR